MLEKKKAIWGYMFILPNFSGFAIFMLFPVIFSLVISFSNWDIVTPLKLIGLENYFELFKDDKFIKSLLNTLYYTVLTVPTGVVFALLFAVILNRKIKGIGIYRTFTFLPVVTSSVAVSLIWSILYGTDYGLINVAMSYFGLPGVGWLTDTRVAMISVSIVSIWKGLGYNMTIYLAGLQGIPRQLFEAAKIDGASSGQSFFHITLPLLAPTTYFIVVMSIIGSLQVFDQVYIMTNGGPADATRTIVMYLYQNAFQFLRMGYASAMAYILFLIIFVLSLIQFSFSKKLDEFTY